eukprot:5090869-Amphidinium_carterae.1
MIASKAPFQYSAKEFQPLDLHVHRIKSRQNGHQNLIFEHDANLVGLALASAVIAQQGMWNSTDLLIYVPGRPLFSSEKSLPIEIK